MKKHILEYIETIIKEKEERNESYTPLGSEIFESDMKLLNGIKKWIEDLNDIWENTNLISCDFEENTMTFELPKWLQLRGWKYYIEYIW